MKYAIKHEVGSVYWLEGEDIAFTPINTNGTFDTEAGGIVDEELTRGEVVNGKRFEDLYAEVRLLLSE